MEASNNLNVVMASASHLLGIIKASASSVASLPQRCFTSVGKSVLCNNLVIHRLHIVLRPHEVLKPSSIQAKCMFWWSYIGNMCKIIKAAVCAFHEFPELCTKSQVDGHCVTFARWQDRNRNFEKTKSRRNKVWSKSRNMFVQSL